MTKIRSPNSVDASDISNNVCRAVRTYLKRYLEGLVKIPYFDEPEKRRIIVHQMGGKYDEREDLYRCGEFPFGGGEYDEYIIELGERREYPLFGIVGKRGRGSPFRIVSEIDRYKHPIYGTRFFDSTDEFWLIDGILKEFGCSSNVVTLREDNSFMKDMLLLINETDYRPATSCEYVERRVDNMALATKAVIDTLKGLEKKMRERGKQIARGYMSGST